MCTHTRTYHVQAQVHCTGREDSVRGRFQWTPPCSQPHSGFGGRTCQSSAVAFTDSASHSGTWLRVAGVCCGQRQMLSLLILTSTCSSLVCVAFSLWVIRPDITVMVGCVLENKLSIYLVGFLFCPGSFCSLSKKNWGRGGQGFFFSQGQMRI